MSTIYHTPIPYHKIADETTFNSPLGQLDAHLDDAMTFAVNNNAEMAAARSPYASLDARLDAITFGYVGGNIATLTNGAASAGQKNVTVDSTDGFLAGAYVAYQLVGGAVEYNLIASITPTTVLSLTTNIGAGGIADDSYIGMVSVSEYQAANAIPHAAALTLPQAMAYANHGVFNANAYGASPSASAAVNAAAIQAAIDAAVAAGGGTMQIQQGVYEIDDTLNIASTLGLRFSGSMGPYGTRGTILKWAGADSTPMVYVFNSQDIEIDHIGFDGDNTAGSTAILFDSDNTQVTKRIHVHDFFIRKCNLGLVLGTNAPGSSPQYQVDSFSIHNFGFTEMTGTSACIALVTQNASTIAIRDGEMAGATYGLWIKLAGFSSIHNVAGGVLTDFVRVSGPHLTLKIDACQAESVTNFLNVTADGATTAPIVIVSSVIDGDINLDGLTYIVSEGNYYNADVLMTADSSKLISILDTFATGTVSKTGTYTEYYRLDIDGLNLSGTHSMSNMLTGTATWAFTGLANGAAIQKDVTVTGAAPGDICTASHPAIALSKLLLSATVVSTNLVYVTLFNATGGSYDLPTGTLTVNVQRMVT